MARDKTKALVRPVLFTGLHEHLHAKTDTKERHLF